MRILIIGAKGNLGGVLADAYLDHQVIAWDMEDIDITNREMVVEKISAERPDVVYNCAAYNAVDKAEEESAVANLVNGYAVGYLAEACRAIDAILVHFSTNYVFNGSKGSEYVEGDVPTPESAYARSKTLGEQELARVGGKTYLVRTSLLYGGKKTGGKKSFVDIMLDAAETKPELNVVNDEFGSPTLVSDLAAAVKTLVIEKYPFGIYHLVNQGAASWYDWATELFRLRNKTITLHPVPATSFPRPAKRPTYAVLANTKGPTMRPWQEALANYLES